MMIVCFPGVSVVKNPPANAGDAGLIPGLGRSPGEGNGNPLQYSCLEDPMDRGPTPVFLPGESHGQRSFMSYSPRGRKCWTQLSDFHFVSFS